MHFMVYDYRKTIAPHDMPMRNSAKITAKRYAHPKSTRCFMLLKLFD